MGGIHKPESVFQLMAQKCATITDPLEKHLVQTTESCIAIKCSHVGLGLKSLKLPGEALSADRKFRLPFRQWGEVD